MVVSDVSSPQMLVMVTLTSPMGPAMWTVTSVSRQCGVKSKVPLATSLASDASVTE